MPRQARKKSQTGIYHIMLRGINRQSIFEDSEDRKKFLERMSYYKEISHYDLFAYCLMDNHIHLLLREQEDSISDIVKRISSSYVLWFNKKYERYGHLFQDRFKSEAVEDERYFLVVLRYIHQNPVKAGITSRVDGHIWSSYHEYMGKALYTNVDYALSIFSPDRKVAINLFREFMNSENDDECLDDNIKRRVTDEEILEYLHRTGISNISELQKLERINRDKILREVRKIDGVTIRQLARVTGLSKSVIDRC